ncbi:MAG: HK97 family phage prohead protease, partial [Christensenellales bacterium]
GDQDALNLYARVQRGDVSQCSIGFDITAEEQIQRDSGWHFTIRRLTLYEVSVVTFPAYEDTGVEARCKSAKAMRRRALEQWKQDMKGRIHHGTQNDSEQA